MHFFFPRSLFSLFSIGTKRAVKHGSEKFQGMEGDSKYKSLSIGQSDESDDSFENEVTKYFLV